MIDFLGWAVPIAACLFSAFCGYNVGRQHERIRTAKHCRAELGKLIDKSHQRTAILRGELLAMGIDPDDRTRTQGSGT